MNRSALEGVQGLLLVLEGGFTSMRLEIPQCRYRREAAECERNAEQATKTADQLAWRQLAEDWEKLALTAEVNPRLSTVKERA
jgi:hypothetical protein